MINKIRKRFSIRQCFILCVLLLLASNLLFMFGYYNIYFRNKTTKEYNKIQTDMNTYLSSIENISTQEELEKTVQEYVNNNKNIDIYLQDSTNTIIKEFTNKTDNKDIEQITKTKVFLIEEKPLLVTMSYHKNTLHYRITIDFLLFELFTILLLTIMGILGANLKILSPITSLSKDMNNYKLGIMPKRRKIRGEIDALQNSFVDLVSSLEEEKQKQFSTIACISHDIKTPLTSIMGYAELLKKENIAEATRQKYAHTIYEKAITLKELIEEVDTYVSYHIKEEKKLEKISIKYIVSYLEDYYKEDLNNENIEFKVKTNCPNVYILVDIAKFKRIFSNTITNSIRALTGSNKKIYITIRETKDKKIKFEIKDNGIGTKEDLNKLFAPFYTTDESRMLSGLGLAICKEIVESHQGNIYATNNNLGGLSIVFTIDAYKEKKR